MMRLKDKVAVVTGGTSGIGRRNVHRSRRGSRRGRGAHDRSTRAGRPSFVNGADILVDGGLIGGRRYSEVAQQSQAMRALFVS